MESYAARAAALIEAAKAAGQAAKDADTRAAALLFVGAVQGVVMQSLLTGDPARLRGALRLSAPSAVIDIADAPELRGRTESGRHRAFRADGPARVDL